MDIQNVSDTTVVSALVILIVVFGIWGTITIKRGVKSTIIALPIGIVLGIACILAMITAFQDGDYLFMLFLALVPFIFYFTLVWRIDYDKERIREHQERKKAEKKF